MMKLFWDKRYSEARYAYGVKPNAFFKAQIDKIKPGSVLLPAEGEGRNAIYAASRGWDVTAFDISAQGKEKAVQLAERHNVSINYQVVGVLDFESTKKFDCIGLSYAHFPDEIRKKAHSHLLKCLKPNGIIIFEAFAKAQLGNSSGGPKHADMLFDLNTMQTELPRLDFSLLKEETITLNEGIYHQGKAAVIRFVGRLK